MLQRSYAPDVPYLDLLFVVLSLRPKGLVRGRAKGGPSLQAGFACLCSFSFLRGLRVLLLRLPVEHVRVLRLVVESSLR